VVVPASDVHAIIRLTIPEVAVTARDPVNNPVFQPYATVNIEQPAVVTGFAPRVCRQQWQCACRYALCMKRAPVRTSSSIAALAPQSPKKKSSRSPRDFKDRALSMAEKEWSVARGRKNESKVVGGRQYLF